MIFNFQESKHELSQDYDFCICGSGPSGISLALSLAKTGKKIVLLEGGDDQITQESQSLYNAETVASGFNQIFEYSLSATRARALGGTSNFWAGRCKPFTSYDFEGELNGEFPGWPISYEEIQKYLEPAMSILDLDIQKGFTDYYNAGKSSDYFIPDTFQASPPTRFASKYRTFLESTPNLDVFVNANVTYIHSSNEGQIEQVSVKDFEDTASTPVRAKNFIIAMGAVENARILLISNDVFSSGIGNDHDLVGRCFMEHYNVDMGEFVPNEEYWVDRKYASFYTADALLKEKNIGAGNLHLSYLGERGSSQGGRAAPLRYLIQDLSCKYNLSDSLQWLLDHTCPGMGIVTTLTEQTPNKNSRIVLTNKLDALGMKTIKLHWDMNAYDANTIRKQAIFLAKDIAKWKMGRVKLPDYIVDETLPIQLFGHAHHTGTTRMAAEKEHGVVDVNSKVFGTKNLYVAGPSVFSTGGGNNPTMPGIQLALRLADHLIAQEQ